MPQNRTIGSLGAVLTLASTLGAQTVYHVDAAGPGGDGLAWATALDDLHQALAAALPGDEIRVAQGVYRPALAGGDRTISFDLPSGVTVLGGYAGTTQPDPDERDVLLYPTILDGDLNEDDDPEATHVSDPSLADNSVHVLIAENLSAMTTLDGLTVRRGVAYVQDGVQGQQRGGGLRIVTSDLALEDCTFEYNFGSEGVGVTAELGSRLTMRHTTLQHHVRRALLVTLASHLVAEYCEFCDNTTDVGNGGGLETRGGTLQLSHCNFRRNSTGPTYAGSALKSGAAISTVADCRFEENSAPAGGAVAYGGSVETHVYERCVFLNNEASGTAGAVQIRGDHGKIIFLDCEFTGNTAGYGAGALFFDDQPDALVDRCIFRDNSTAEDGGAIDTYGTKTIGLTSRLIVNSLFEGNSAKRGGAAAAGLGLSFVNCHFLENSAEIGGAIFVSTTTVDIGNCVFLANQATSGTGGAIHCRSVADHHTTVTGSTIVGNEASAGGGGICVDRELILDLTNTILWHNTGGQGSTEEMQLLALRDVENINARHCCIEGLDVFAGPGNVDADPLLVGPGDDGLWGTVDDDLRLSAGSPCIDAGCNYDVPQDAADLDADGVRTEILPFDFELNPRFQNVLASDDTGCGVAPIVDIGAYETAGQAGPPPCRGDLDGDLTVDQSDLGLLLAAYNLNAAGDLDCDGRTTQADLAILLANYGVSCQR